VHFIDKTIGQRFEAHAKKLQPLIDGRNVSLVARQSVEAFGDEHLNAAGGCIIHKTMQTRTVDDGRAGDSRIFVDGDLLQTTRVGIFLRHRHLIGDRAVVLQVTRKPRINRRTHRFTPLG
jgi:hypothetical protein